MKKKIFVLLILFFAMNCGGSADPSPNLSPEASSDTVEGLPEWFLNSPEKDGFQYMAAEATSRQMQLAIDKARTDAVTSLSSMINSEWSGYVKRIQEEITEGIAESIEVIKSTNSMSNNELLRTAMFSWFLIGAHSYGLAILLADYVFKQGIKYTDFYESLFEYLQHNNNQVKEWSRVRRAIVACPP